jgi:hypothetical protein
MFWFPRDEGGEVAAPAAPARGYYGNEAPMAPTVAKYSLAGSAPVVCVKNGVKVLPMLSSPM